MGIYKPKKSPFWHYDFESKRRRFLGSCKTGNKREAQQIERAKREEAAAQLKAEALTDGAPLTIDRAAGRYWVEVGQHHSAATTTWTNLDRLIKHFGKAKLLSEISTDHVAQLVALRRQDTVRGRRFVIDPDDRKNRRPAPLVKPGTVNRSTIEPLQKIFNRARRVWKYAFKDEPDWNEVLLQEPSERVREVRPSEEAPLASAIRPDYLPLIDFARASGLRMAECLLRKDEVDLIEGRIHTIGKGKKKINLPVTTEMRAILMSAMANTTDYVFTYQVTKGRGPQRRVGERRPITKSGLKSLWRRARRKGLPADLRFHDLRHDFGTKLLRETGNLKLVSIAMNHSKIETTAKYAHVLDDEVRAGMEAAAESRKKSRTQMEEAIKAQ
jgi:integrase